MAAKRKDEEIPVSEIAMIAGVHRQTAYWACRSGEIKGARLISGKVWVAPRGEALKYKQRRKKLQAERRVLAAENPIAGAVDTIREGISEFRNTVADLGDRLRQLT